MIQAQLKNRATPNIIPKLSSSFVPIVKFLYTSCPFRATYASGGHSNIEVERYYDLAYHLDGFAVGFEGRKLPMFDRFYGEFRQDRITADHGDGFNRSVLGDDYIESHRPRQSQLLGHGAFLSLGLVGHGLHGFVL